MPCSCSRCTSRSRVRADVMPMPLRRGPSVKLLKLESALEFGKSRVARQIDLQWRDGRETPGNGVKIRARTRVLTGTRGSHPVHVAAARVLGGHNRFAAMPAAEARDLDPAQFTVQQVRNIHVEHDRSLQRLD